MTGWAANLGIECSNQMTVSENYGNQAIEVMEFYKRELLNVLPPYLYPVFIVIGFRIDPALLSILDM